VGERGQNNWLIICVWTFTIHIYILVILNKVRTHTCIHPWGMLRRRKIEGGRLPHHRYYNQASLLCRNLSVIWPRRAKSTRGAHTSNRVSLNTLNKSNTLSPRGATLSHSALYCVCNTLKRSLTCICILCGFHKRIYYQPNMQLPRQPFSTAIFPISAAPY